MLKLYIVHLNPFFEHIVRSFSPGVYSVVLHSIGGEMTHYFGTTKLHR